MQAAASLEVVPSEEEAPQAQAAGLFSLLARAAADDPAPEPAGAAVRLAQVEAVLHLIGGERPDTSWLGMALVTSSVIGMPLLGMAKVRLAHQLGSPATKGEGNQNLLCAYLAGAVLAGLAGNALFGLWWLDPVAALVIAAVAVREGVQTWRGEGCCAAPGLHGAACADGCCPG